MPPQNFYGLPPSWNPGYDIPDYVMAEPPGRGTFTTAWLPRGTISGMVPEFQAVKAGTKILGRNDAGLGSLGDDTLGVGVGRGSSDGADPITGYGQKAASWLMHSIKSVPSDKRSQALRAVFDAVDPSLWNKVQTTANTLRAGGMAAPAALQGAIAKEMSAGMLAEFVAAGKRRQRGDRQPVKRTGQLALGVYPDAGPKATVYALESLGLSWDGVKSWAKKAAAVVIFPPALLSSSVSPAISKFAQQAVKAVSSLACSVASNPAAGLAATAAGGPAAGAGTAALSTACAKPGATMTMMPMAPPPPTTPKWVLPAAIGGGALLVGALVFSRRK